MRRTSKPHGITRRILSTVVCLCIIIATALTSQRSGTAAATGSGSADTATVTLLDNGTTVINTTSIASDLRGYGGAVPMKVYIRGNRIDSIRTLPNNETPEFLDIVRDEVISRYIGLDIDKALSTDIDAVTGATMSSECVKGTVRRALAVAARTATDSDDTAAGTGGALKLMAALAVSMMAALLPLFIRNSTYRTVQLYLNVIVLGFYCGTFVSYSSLAGMVREPSQLLDTAYLSTHAALLLLAFVALFYPLFGRKGHYCAWCCPLGSLQDLGNKAGKGRQWHITPRWTHRLTTLRKALWVALMAVTWTGMTSAWMDYELFAAFMWQTASWIMLTFLLICAVLSVFVKRPYCRFICPTGTMLKI